MTTTAAPSNHPRTVPSLFPQSLLISRLLGQYRLGSEDGNIRFSPLRRPVLL